MAAAALPASAALQQTPRSPTLSDAGMILPEADLLRGVSPSPSPYGGRERPPSPSSLLYSHSNQSAHTIKLTPAPNGRRGASPQVKSPALSAKSSRSTLRTMPDSDASSRTSLRREDVLASSPTIADGVADHPADEGDSRQRRASIASSSVHSDDIENLKWPGFDSHGGLDDSGVVLEEEGEEEQQHDPFPAESPGEDDLDNDRWLDGQDGMEDALSRRAEMILANAKKRLNVMEGNLRGARQSLIVPPSFNSYKTASELSNQLSAARERDRRLYGGMGPIPPRTRPYLSSPLSANGSPGHIRGMSETSVPLPFSTSNASRTLGNKRASSAMGVGSGPWSPDGYGNGRFPIRESRSFEVVPEHRSNGWTSDEERDHSRSPSNALETLPEDDSPGVQRSASTAGDLRSQMNDLKGRISSLKLRAQEESMRRRSLQTLRTPSPFTSAEIWYAAADAYKNGGSPVAEDAGVGIKIESPSRKQLFEDEKSSQSTPKIPSPSYGGEEVNGGRILQQQAVSPRDYADSHYEDAQEPEGVEPGVEDVSDEDDGEDIDFVSLQGDELDGTGESVYEDAVYEMPATERHEDRVDAFDYEHFFLHSAMGTYSQESRRSSSSSASSTATTRPVTAIHSREESVGSGKRVSIHQRNPSADSVSTVATFATAAEEQSDEEDNEPMGEFSEQLASKRDTITPRYATQNNNTTWATTQSKANGSLSPSTSQSPRGSSPAGDVVVAGLQTSKMYSILLEKPAHSEQPRLALSEEEKQLIYGLASSFQQVCANLQSASGEAYERREWRRRLDSARRLLNGEELEGPSF